MSNIAETIADEFVLSGVSIDVSCDDVMGQS